MIGCDCDVCMSDDPKNNRMRTSVLVKAPDGNFLIDTPPELRIQLIRENVSLIHAAMYTHSHADHIYGMDDLRIFGYRLKSDVPIYCEEIVETFLKTAFPYAFTEPHPELHKGAVPKLRLEKLTLSPFELLGMKVQPIRLFHGNLPVLGFRIGNVAFCTDVSRIPDESWEHLEGLDVLIIDALREEAHPTHFNVEQSLKVIEKVKPKKAYFTHISHSLEHHATNAAIPENVEMAYDGLRIPIS